MKLTTEQKDLVPLLQKYVHEYDTLIVIDSEDVFNYDNLPFSNIRIIKSSALVLKAKDTVKQVCDYVFSIGDDFPENVKFIFVSQMDLEIPDHERFIYIKINHKGKEGNE